MMKLLMKHLIDIVINQVFRKIIFFPTLLNSILYLNTLKDIFTYKYRLKRVSNY